MTQISNCNDQIRLYAHKGVLVLTPSAERVKLHMITGDNSYATLGSEDLATLVGLLIGELARVRAAHA